MAPVIMILIIPANVIAALAIMDIQGSMAVIAVITTIIMVIPDIIIVAAIKIKNNTVAIPACIIATELYPLKKPGRPNLSGLFLATFIEELLFKN